MATIQCPHCQRVIPLVLVKDGVCPNCMADIRPPSLVSPPPIVAAPKIILSKTYVKPNRIKQRSRNLPITVTVIAVCGVLLIAAIGFALRKTTTAVVRNQSTPPASKSRQAVRKNETSAVASASILPASSELPDGVNDFVRHILQDELTGTLPEVRITGQRRNADATQVWQGKEWTYWLLECSVRYSRLHGWEDREVGISVSGNEIAQPAVVGLGSIAEQYDNDAPRRKKQAEYDAKYRELEIVVSKRVVSDPVYRNANMNVPIGELIERQIGPRP